MSKMPFVNYIWYFRHDLCLLSLYIICLLPLNKHAWEDNDIFISFNASFIIIELIEPLTSTFIDRKSDTLKVKCRVIFGTYSLFLCLNLGLTVIYLS